MTQPFFKCKLNKNQFPKLSFYKVIFSADLLNEDFEGRCIHMLIYYGEQIEITFIFYSLEIGYGKHSHIIECESLRSLMAIDICYNEGCQCTK